MDRRLKICFMIDFYGQMLTKKQFEVMDLYYNNDYSLSEIAKINEVSRQAVSDTKRRSLEMLTEYESKLNLVNKFIMINELVKDSVLSLNKIKYRNLTENDEKILKNVKNNLSSIIKEI